MKETIATLYVCGLGLIILSVLGFALAGIRKLRPYKLRASLIVVISWCLITSGMASILSPFWIYSDQVASAQGSEVLSVMIYGLSPIPVLLSLGCALREAKDLWHNWPFYRF